MRFPTFRNASLVTRIALGVAIGTFGIGCGGKTTGGNGSGSSSGGTMTVCAQGASCSGTASCTITSGGPYSCPASCSCDNGAYECAEAPCAENDDVGDDAQDAGGCPAQIPDGGACDETGITCDYDTNQGNCGGVSCSCSDGAWLCAAAPCSPPACPASQPDHGASCANVNQECGYTTSSNHCGAVDCNCTTNGWSCGPTCITFDAGSVPDGS